MTKEEYVEKVIAAIDDSRTIKLSDDDYLEALEEIQSRLEIIVDSARESADLTDEDEE